MTAAPLMPSPGSNTVFESARLELARLSVSHERPLREALRQLAGIVAGSLQVARMSFWVHIQDGRAICCEFLYQPATRVVYEGAMLYARDFPGYFAALAQRRVVAVSDTRNDPIAAEFRRPYFEPLGISAMLDAPVYRDGEVMGIVCHEQVGSPRVWLEHEREFAASVADIVARLHAEAECLQAASTLDSFQAHVMQLQRAGTVGRLAAGMAHDFRNILGAISGFAELMRASDDSNPALQDYAAELKQALNRGSELTQELLTLSQELPCRPAVTDLGAMLKAYEKLLQMALAPGVMLRMVLAEKSARVFVDVAQIERAVLNLVVNASDAMPSGGTVTVSLYENVSPGNSQPPCVVIEVADTGLGMDASTRELMFEPFFTTKGDSGTGLGLSIVQQIVHHAGGRIDVDTQPGRGTRVRLLLPPIS